MRRDVRSWVIAVGVAVLVGVAVYLIASALNDPHDRSPVYAPVR